MTVGYVYILLCNDNSYYVGSTNDLQIRVNQHNDGIGANYTKKRLPVKLVYYEEYSSLNMAFSREKQIQGWSRIKKEALINEQFDNLHKLSECMNDTHFVISQN